MSPVQWAKCVIIRIHVVGTSQRISFHHHNLHRAVKLMYRRTEERCSHNILMMMIWVWVSLSHNYFVFRFRSLLSEARHSPIRTHSFDWWTIFISTDYRVVDQIDWFENLHAGTLTPLVSKAKAWACLFVCLFGSYSDAVVWLSYLVLVSQTIEHKYTLTAITSASATTNWLLHHSVVFGMDEIIACLPFIADEHLYLFCV